MKKFILHIAFYLFVILSCCLGGTWIISKRVANQAFANWNTDSNLLMLQEGATYDCVILGNSHARNFSRHGNHLSMEETLEKSILNLGQGRGICGPSEQQFYLSYAIKNEIRFNHLIITVSPPYLFGNAFNEATATFYAEPFRFDFLLHYLRHDGQNKEGRLMHYLRSKWSPLWWKLEPESGQPKIESLKQLDSLALPRGFELAFPAGRTEVNFMANAAHIESAIALAKTQEARITLLSTPTLFGHWPGQERVARYADSLAIQDEKIRYVDLTNVIQDPGLFYDHHHLNSAGIDSLLSIMKRLEF